MILTLVSVEQFTTIILIDHLGLTFVINLAISVYEWIVNDCHLDDSWWYNSVPD